MCSSDLATVPPSLVTYLKRCLQKDAKQRVQAIGDVRLALDGAFEMAAAPAPSTTTATARGRVWMGAFAVAVLGMAALALPAVRHLRETPPPLLPETRVDLVTPATDSPVSFALSPDGRQIVFAATEAGGARLWLRSLATTTAQPLVGTEGASYPFWSPDGRAIGFFAGNALKRLDFGGGAPQTLAPVTGGFGGTWNADGVILFAPSTGPLLRVAATGGLAVAVTTLAPSQQAHYGPAFLPDGRRFLFVVAGAPDTAGIYLGALDGGPPTRLTPAASPGWYLPTGWLLWVRAGTATLVAQRLDVETAAITGAPVTLADGVAVDTVLIRAAVSVAATGLVAYRTGGGGLRQLTWVDRAGTARGTLGEPDATLLNPRVAPDGRRVAVARTVQGNQDLWLLDGARTTRFTFDPAADRFPVWSPDGARLVFYSARTGVGDLYAKLTSGAGVEERLVASDQTKGPTSWSADGRFLLYTNISPKTSSDVWVLPMAGDPKPLPFLNSTFTETVAGFSLDGHWVAYQSDESGHYEIYVRPFPGPGGQWQVSTGGGIHPVWRPDGKELYYLNPGGAMMAAPISVTGTAVAPGAPVMLFPTRILGGGVDTQNGRQYDVAPDGRFLINTVLDSATAPITLLMNWNPEAKK